MLKEWFRSIRVLLLSFSIVGLTACGNGSPGSDSTARSPAHPAASRPERSGAASSPSSQPVALATRYDDIAQSKTPEGYYVLGTADAPITIKHYSDFL